ncbi:MAG: hypothetical protein ACUVQZ_08605 [Candidatus Caldatribacteriaceae bacterium]
MGTFLKVVGIIVLIFGILFIILLVVGMGSIFGLRSLTQPYTLPSPGEENFPPTPFVGGLSWLGGIGSIVGGFGIIVCGVVLFCIGSIYNDVKNLREP